MLHLKRHCFLFFLACGLSSFGQSFNTASVSKLTDEINKLKNAPEMEYATFGISVKAVSTGKVIAEYNSHQSMKPASTLKLFTTAAALTLLGEDFRFQTILEYDGYISGDGILHGNLYIRGGGDPSLDSELFKADDSTGVVTYWVGEIKKAGIQSITGSVIADESIFPDDPVPSYWIWGDMGNYYGAGAFGLNFRDNYFGILLESGKKEGDSVKILYTSPAIKDLKLYNRLSSGGSGDNTIIYGSPYEYKRHMTGMIPVNKTDFRVKASLPDPALFCAMQLQKGLIDNSINVFHEATTVRLQKENNSFASEKRIQLDTLYSPTLDTMVEMINIKSLNMYCEALVKMLSLKYNGYVSTSAGIQLIKDFYASKGGDLVGFFMTDGSGLSLSNAVSTNHFSTFLVSLAKDRIFSSFKRSLPVAGKTGSLSTMLKGTVAEGKLTAKSGTLTGVRTFAGYTESKNGELLAFSVMVNNYGYSGNDMKKKLEKILLLIAEL